MSIEGKSASLMFSITFRVDGLVDCDCKFEFGDIEQAFRHEVVDYMVEGIQRIADQTLEDNVPLM